MTSFSSLKRQVAQVTGVFTETVDIQMAGEVTPNLAQKKKEVTPLENNQRRTEEEMQNSPEEQRREETYHLYSPCYLCEQVVKAFLKCLGHESHDSTPEQATNSPSEAERDMKITEEFEVQSTSFIRAMPPRPPISSGRGGQINYASS